MLRRIVRVALVLVVAALVYWCVTFVQVYSASHRDEATEAQAIIVLGAAQYNGTPSPVFQTRLDHAKDLYDNGIAPMIVVTGGKIEGDQFTEATAGAVYLRSAGVPDDDILREVQGTNSWEELAAVARFLRARDVVDVVLVTDGYHALRVKAIADELGLHPHVSPSPSGKSRTNELRSLVRETAAVAAGRIVGFRRLVDLDGAVARVRREERGG